MLYLFLNNYFKISNKSITTYSEVVENTNINQDKISCKIFVRIIQEFPEFYNKVSEFLSNFKKEAIKDTVLEYTLKQQEACRHHKQQKLKLHQEILRTSEKIK